MNVDDPSIRLQSNPQFPFESRQQVGCTLRIHLQGIGRELNRVGRRNLAVAPKLGALIQI